MTPKITEREGTVLSFQANIRFGWMEPTAATRMAVGTHFEQYAMGMQTTFQDDCHGDLKAGDKVRFTEQAGSVMALCRL